MFAGVLILTAFAGGSEIEDILGPEPTVDRRVAATPTDPLGRQVEEAVREPGIKVFAMPSIGFTTFKLSGDGMTAHLPAGSTLRAQFGLSGIRWKVGILAERRSFSGLPSSISPSQISVTSWEAFGEYRVATWGSFEIFAGYRVFARDAEQTSPQPIVTSFLAHGPQFSLNSIWNVKQFVFTGRADIASPWYFNETGSVTGSYRYGLKSRLQGFIRREFFRRFSAGIGLELLTQILFFSGAGSRGSVNATELEIGVSVPIQVRYEF